MEWSEFAQAAPGLARLGEERLERAGLVLVGTVRRDGSPRISPVEPLLLDGDLFLGMMWQSRKALDLLRDHRCLVHSVICDRNGREGEFKLRGRAAQVTDPATRQRYAQAIFDKTDWRPEEPYHLFKVAVESASYVVFDEEGHQTIGRWRPGRPERTTRRRWTGSAYEDERP